MAKSKTYSVFLVCASAYSFICVSSLLLCFSIYYVEVLETFQESRYITGLIPSSMYLASQFTGLLQGSLIRRFGNSTIATIGALIIVIALLLTATVSFKIQVIYATYFALGIGMAMLRVPNLVVIQRSFTKNRTLAASLSLCGLSIGTMATGPVLRYSITHFGWRGTHLMHACFIAQSIVLSRLLPRKVITEKEKSGKTTQLEVNETKRPPEELNDVAMQETVNNEKLYHDNDHQHTDDVPNVCNSEHKGPLQTAQRNKCLKYFQKYAYFQLLTDSLVPFYGLHQFLSALKIGLIFGHSPNRILELGGTKKQASLVLLCIGIATSIGRPLGGFIGNLSCVNRCIQAAVGSFIGGVFVIIVGFVDDLVLTFCLLFACGFFTAIQMTLQPTILADLSGLPRLPYALGLTSVFFGLGMALAIPFSGNIADVTGSLDLAYYIIGSVYTSSTALALFIFYRTRKPK